MASASLRLVKPASEQPCSTEIWRDIPGHEGRYQASTHGRIRSLKRNLIMQGDLVCGYLQIRLSKNGLPDRRKVHHFVLETFVSPRPEGKECRHLNGDRTDNRLANLAWGTSAENGRDKASHHSLKGTRHGMNRLTPFQAFMLRESSLGNYVLGRLFGVTGASIESIKKGRNWAWL